MNKNKNDTELLLAKLAENRNNECRILTVCGTGPASKEEEEEVKKLLKEIKISLNKENNK